MSDMRFILIGLITVTVGFIVLGVFGAQFTEITVQTKEFSECYKYPEDQPPVRIECDEYLQDKNLLFILSDFVSCVEKKVKKLFFGPSKYSCNKL